MATDALPVIGPHQRRGAARGVDLVAIGTGHAFRRGVGVDDAVFAAVMAYHAVIAQSGPFVMAVMVEVHGRAAGMLELVGRQSQGGGVSGQSRQQSDDKPGAGDGVQGHNVLQSVPSGAGASGFSISS